MTGTPWWQSVLTVAGSAVVAIVAVVLTRRDSRQAIAKAEARADRERDLAGDRRRDKQYLALVREVVEGLRFPESTVRPPTPPEVAALEEDEGARRALIALDSLPAHYLPLHRVYLWPLDLRDAATDELLRKDPGSLRREARVTMQALVAGHEPPSPADYLTADRPTWLSAWGRTTPPAPEPGSST